ncbi:hypothetical protein [Longimicrobium sp.]|uniref:hypothetical protein n=1 Tax=Longimicrobium sp. TaxID=2029185 RepID=UPI002BE2075C|nr:hypothetical protein [Longimicrobium sp.]HSU17367.1 hypothetical protein [Longimicrobium sp.]
MQNKLLPVSLLVSTVFLCGCQIEGFHKLERYGNPDRGWYQVSMDNVAWSMFVNSSNYGSTISDLHRFSNPTIRTLGDRTYIEDLSGTAQMEHSYDNYTCSPDPVYSRYMICDYYVVGTDRYQPGWSIKWTVELDPDMQMLSSNHHSTQIVGGRQRYIWYFDGNIVSSFNIHFRVRTPIA